MDTNKKFKDTVFTTLFGSPDILRELYCALEGVTLPPDVPISIATLENVLVMDKYNDIAFRVGEKLIVLIEHQSTINPNMALRLLMYISETYKRSIKGKDLFLSKPIPIPWPEFYVLYNGIEPYPDNSIVKLSDLFKKPEDLGLPVKTRPLLELEVKVININEGRNEEIVSKCRDLSDYTMFIAKARSIWLETGDLREGIIEAVKFCQKHGILKKFLESYASEVINMLYDEWNLDDALFYAREEGREEERLEIARNALTEGLNPEYVQKITGLPIDEIAKLKS